MRRIVPQHTRVRDARIVVAVEPHEGLAEEDEGVEVRRRRRKMLREQYKRVLRTIRCTMHLGQLNRGIAPTRR